MIVPIKLKRIISIAVVIIVIDVIGDIITHDRRMLTGVISRNNVKDLEIVKKDATSENDTGETG